MSTLHDAGYEPGDYMYRCIDCKQVVDGDKHAWRCKPCAEKWLALRPAPPPPSAVSSAPGFPDSSDKPITWDSGVYCKEEDGGFVVYGRNKEQLFSASRGSRALTAEVMTLDQAVGALFAVASMLLRVDERSNPSKTSSSSQPDADHLFDSSKVIQPDAGAAKWPLNNPEAMASIERGLAQAQAGLAKPLEPDAGAQAQGEAIPESILRAADAMITYPQSYTGYPLILAEYIRSKWPRIPVKPPAPVPVSQEGVMDALQEAFDLIADLQVSGVYCLGCGERLEMDCKPTCSIENALKKFKAMLSTPEAAQPRETTPCQCPCGCKRPADGHKIARDGKGYPECDWCDSAMHAQDPQFQRAQPPREETR